MTTDNNQLTDEARIREWVRSTLCFRKDEGAWVVTHEHTSVPFDAESGKASVDLKPSRRHAVLPRQPDGGRGRRRHTHALPGTQGIILTR